MRLADACTIRKWTVGLLASKKIIFGKISGAAQSPANLSCGGAVGFLLASYAGDIMLVSTNIVMLQQEVASCSQKGSVNAQHHDNRTGAS